MKTVILLSMLLVGCTPYVESNKERTRVGVSIDHKQVEQFIFNLFTRKESVNLVNEKTR